MRVPELIKNPKVKKTVVVPMAQIDHVIQCVGYTQKYDFADYILIGDTAAIRLIAEKEQVDLSGVEMIEETDEATACDYAASLAGKGRAQVVMKGLVLTSTFVRSLLSKKNNLKPEGGLISQVSVFDIPLYHKALILTDAGINISPGLQEKVQIIKNAVNVAHSLGITAPKVACIAPSEEVTKKISSTTDARELKQMKGVFGDAIVDGPFGFDIAVSKKAAEIKNVDSMVAGDADILLFPELNSGNAVYKSLTIFGGATATGLIAGLRVPVVLTSRSDTDEVKKLSLLLALSVEERSIKGFTETTLNL
jgi:phosphate butyryltransferase